MVQVIRIKRNVTTALAPTTLDPGELAYTKAGHKLYVGDDTNTVNNLVSVDRQLEIHANSPAQAIDPAAGAKTFPLAKLKVPGGNVGEFLSITNVDGTLGYAPMVSATQEFIGSIDAAAGTVTLIGGGAALPSPVGISGKYLITEVSGASPPAGVPDAGAQYDQGDWLISNGTIWTHLFFGGISTVTAADVGVAPAVAGGSNVQDALENLETAQGDFVVGPATSVADQLALYTDATGKLIKAGPALNTLATVGYVDGQDDAQDLIIAANAAAITALQTNDTAQDAAIATKGDVSSTLPVVATHIASFLDVGGKMIVDGGIATTDIALKTDLTGLGDVVGTPTTTANHVAAYSDTTGLLIKDGGIATTDIALKADLLPLGDVKGPAAATLDHIAVYSDTTGKLIKNGTKSIATLDADIAARGDVFSTAPIAAVNNLAMFSTVGGKMIVDSTYSVQDLKDYVDTAIGAIPGATLPVTKAPEMAGDGMAATPITFMGLSIAVNSQTAFTGNGSSTAPGAPLDLVLVDGGTF